VTRDPGGVASLAQLDATRRWALPASVVPVLIAATSLVVLEEGPNRAAVIGYSNAAVATLASMVFYRRARAEPLARRGWGLLTISTFVYGMSQAVATAPRLGAHSLPPFPTAGDFAALLFLPVAGVAMLLWPGTSTAASTKVRTALDGLTFGTASFFLMWTAGVGPRTLASVPRDMILVAVGFFVACAINLGVAIHLAGREAARWRGPIGAMTVAFLLASVSGVPIVALGSDGRYYSGHAVDTLDTFAITIGIWGAVGVKTARPVAPAATAPTPSSWVAELVPYAPALVVVALGLLDLASGGGGLDVVQIGTAVFLMVLLGARQLLAIRDVRRLSHNLEVQVAQRTQELRESQAALLHAQRLDALGQMSGGVAHDFNNLLTIVSTSARALRPTVPSSHAGDLDAIDAAVDRAAGLTRQLLAFARKQPVMTRLVDVDDLLARAEPLLIRLVGAEFRLTLSLGGAGRPVSADPGQLEQVVVNLVQNARDAAPSDRHVAVITSIESIAAGALEPLAAGEYVVLEVRDRGDGMPESVRGRAFEPFFTTKPPGRGTGLGLATCWGIVRQAGGHITIESAPERGTRVRVFLPVAKADAAGARHPSLPPPVPPTVPLSVVPPPSEAKAERSARAPSPGPGPPSLAPVSPVPSPPPTVLVADDTDGVRTAIARVIRDLGYHVIEASDGQAAAELASAEGTTIALLVTDLVMPRLSGRELAARVRARHPGAKVLTVSGFGEDLGDLPAELVLTKPFRPEELEARVRALLG
jgi:signal transduction histidine kinase/CheY-like chemotaxis protein